MTSPFLCGATAWIDRGDLKGGDGVALDVPADGLGEHDDGKVSRLCLPRDGDSVIAKGAQVL